MRVSEYRENFVGRGMLKPYARKALKRFNDTNEDVRDLTTADEQDALMVEEK